MSSTSLSLSEGLPRNPLIMEEAQRFAPSTWKTRDSFFKNMYKKPRTKTPRCYKPPVSNNPQLNVFAATPRYYRPMKAISRGSYENSRLCRVDELDITDPCIGKIPRAGVVFYTFIDNELHMCFGRDKKTGDLTDFGGGRSKYENPITCAVREGNEESRFVFSKIDPSQVNSFYCLYSSNMLIIFIPVVAPDNSNIQRITQNNFRTMQFLNKDQCQNRCYNELSDLVWLNTEQICNLFSDRPNVQLFAKVRRFMYSSGEFIKDITCMQSVLMGVFRESEQSSHRTITPKISTILEYSENNGIKSVYCGEDLSLYSHPPGIIVTDKCVM